MTLFHIAAIADWDRAKAQGSYVIEGPFIHLSQRHQVLRPANLLYRGRTDVVLLTIDTARLPAGALVYEPGSHGEDEDFPHLYSVLPIDAVTAEVPFLPQSDGSFQLPEGV